MLRKNNLIPKVYLFLQCEEDIRQYSALYPDVKFVKSPLGLLQTANFMVQYFTEIGIGQYVTIHDDVSEFYQFRSKTDRVVVENVGEMFRWIFSKMRENDVYLCGVSPASGNNPNPYYGYTAHEFTTRLAFVHDVFHCTRLSASKQPIILQEGFEEKQDYQRSVEYYKRDGRVGICHHLSCKHQGYNTKAAKGGNVQVMARSAETDRRATEKFAEHYGEYINVVKNGDNKGCFEIRWRPRGSAFTLRDRTADSPQQRAKDAGARVQKKQKKKKKKETGKGKGKQKQQQQNDGGDATATSATVDIHNRLWCWDAVNTAHWTEGWGSGLRITMVLYNTGGRVEVPMMEVGFLPVAQTAEVEDARKVALAVLGVTAFTEDRSARPAPRGAYLKEALATNPPFVLTLGASPQGKGMNDGRYQQNANNSKKEFQVPYKLVVKYLNLLHPNIFSGTDDSGMFNAIVINKNAIFGKHKDNNTNVGFSAITGLGDYAGGGGLTYEVATVSGGGGGGGSSSGGGGGSGGSSGGGSKDSAPAPSPAGE